MPVGPDFISLQVRDLDTAAAFEDRSACAVACLPAWRCGVRQPADPVALREALPDTV